MKIDEELFELELELLLHRFYRDGISAHNISCILQQYIEIYEKKEHNRIKEQRKAYGDKIKGDKENGPY